MNNYSSAAQQYGSLDLQSKTENASPHQLVKMLIDGALVRIKAATGHMERNETVEKATLIGKAIAIIDGLRGSLDMEKGGDLSTNLDDLYIYMSKQLLLANAENKVEYLNEVYSLLGEIKSSWDSIADKPEVKNKTNNAPQITASVP